MARILMVDDDLDQLATAKQWLAIESHTVETVSSGTKGWQALEGDEFDLVILDWDLPDIQGIDLLKRYRASGGIKPVIMLTGRSSVDNKTEGLDGGADDYLTKPYHMKELEARIRLALRKQESRPQVPKALGTGNEELLKKADLVGTTLASRYEFLSEIGEGGMGLVLKARHPHLDKFVAVKMILRTEMKQETLARFKLEAQVLSKLDHPNLAMVYDFDITEHNRPYMVLEFVEGQGLFDLMQDSGYLPLDQALDIAMQICDGMSHAHALGVVHRDLKPSNVMLKEIAGGGPVVKILDFGCAKLRQMNSLQKAQVLTGPTETLGSPPYMSPEQIQGVELDQRSDIYSLGCLLHEAITGLVPHLGEDAVGTLVKHLNDDVRPLNMTRPDLKFPDAMNRILARALEKQPARRFQSMSDFKLELEKVKVKMQSDTGKQWWNVFGKSK